MSDIEYWTDEQMRMVADVCRDTTQHNYIFLSKDNFALDRMGKAIGESADMHHFGVTVTGEDTHRDRDERNINYPCKYGHSFLSVEPLLGPVHIPVDVERALEWVIVGAMSGPGAVVPKREWIDMIRNSVPAGKIYWKNSMRQFGVDNEGTL
jgi:protein gp37